MRAGKIALTAVVVAGVALVPAGASADKVRPGHGADSLAGKRILLSNDDSVQAAEADGADGRGLYILRKALCAAKADVVVIGPWGQMSGGSRSVSAARQVSVAPPVAIPAGYAGDCATAPSKGLVVGACIGPGACTPESKSVTPADSVELALGTILAERAGWTDGPDLVMTGTNSGANIDVAVNMSGTVGAATAATERGVPAIAVSADGKGGALTKPSDPTYEAAAAYATKVAARLLGRRGASDRLAREGLLLNINVPHAEAGQTLSPRWTEVGQKASGRITYVPDGKGGYRISYAPVNPAPEIDPRSDTAALHDGHISIGAVSIDRNGSAKWLRSLNLTG
ncbi:5'/3'-nucleotidase SurE [Actinomadura sp. 9N407]|uniref:5'/3'-nucleotidase SurE n=1 Tax=Actinomadura sp. 9N407 TaxID=3375154 RepID=UPI0037B74DC9